MIAFRDFDICYVGLQGGGADPDFTGVYDENGSLNLFGYDTSMDWDDDLNTGLNEWYMKQGTLIMPPDSEERVQHYWDWEQYMMDKINPLLPTFAPKGYSSQWSNLKGYNYTDGILQSWGKMYYDGSHTGQLSTNELVITDAAWSDLNPLFQDDTSSSRISNAVLDPLIWYDADLTAWPHLAKSYTYLNDTTIEIKVREGIKWAPGPDAMTGYELDIKDVYFTLYAWKTVSNDVHIWDWVEDMEIVDQYTMKIYVDADSSTPGNQAFAPSLPQLSTNILPEHYLNQTQEGDGVTPDVNHPSWNTFTTNAFGTGLFEIADFTDGVETSLTVNTECWKLDTAITSDEALDFERRFGDFSGGLTQYRIRIIPDRQTAILEFKAGKTDIEIVTDFPDTRDEMLTDPDFTIQSDTTFAYGFYGYNMRESRPQVGDRTLSTIDPTYTNGLALRKAMSYAVDRQEINDVVHKGEWTLTDWPIYPKMGIWCNPNIIRYNFNLDKAREFMAIAGFGSYTPPVPGFTLLVTLSSIMLVATVAGLIIKKKK
ncbi:MAG TPA: ABC transporter substrate-binding protein [Candidatus Bathyarchaeia archaeon]|nr:ABC transporter substrate-binding protein [Candidatus Bathyarchaeia archaeon]